MKLPPNNSPLWLLIALFTICGTACFCLSDFSGIYRHGFVADKDGWTVICTGIAGVLVAIVQGIAAKGK